MNIEKEKSYQVFREELMEKLSEWAASSDMIGEYKLYLDGMSSEVPLEAEFIRTTNIKYSNIESNVLIGDFLGIIHKTYDSHARYEIRYLYNSYLSSGWDYVKTIINDNLKYSETLNLNDITENASDFELMKGRIIARAINYTDNKYALKNCVYRCVGDIAIVLYIFVSDTKEYGLTTFKASKAFTDKWGKTDDELIDAALVNSNVRSVPRMYNGYKEATNPRYETGAYMSIGSNCRLGTGVSGSTFTTYPYTNGAVSFWYPGVSEKLAEMANGDYYVVFTGIHDFHIHPVGTVNPRFLLKTLKDMNKNMNKEGETLSRKIYQYKVEAKELVQLEL